MRLRADIVLVNRGLYESRERARAAILAGAVKVDGHTIRKAGESVAPDAEIEVDRGPEFVSRGGHKLAGALEEFGLHVTGLDAVDVGASTGGFTDCLLQHGAAHVTALDVGYGQLAWRLRNDERVSVYERTNVRTVDPATLGAPFDLAVVDVSFISLLAALPGILALLSSRATLLALVKPQFEAGKGRVGKRGVVRDPATHVEVLERVCAGLTGAGLCVRGLTWSPIKGPEGNIEFWVWADRSGHTTETEISELVAAAHESLGG